MEDGCSVNNMSKDAASTTRTCRMEALKRTMNTTIHSLVRGLRLVKPMNVPKEILKELHDKTVSQFEENVKIELDQMYAEENIEYLLNNLDKLIQETPAGTSSWEPSGDVEADLRAHVAKLKKEKLKVMEKGLQDLEVKNKMLVDKVTRSQSQLLLTRDKILTTVNNFNEMNETHKHTLNQVCEVMKLPPLP